jgi:GH24 family phage-related lysozyme (muramidase)
MRVSQRGINLIKKFEGVRLKAYKPVPTEPGWTIGYGHHGLDVHKGMVITESHAERFLRRDLAAFEQGVERLVTTHINQNRFDALVSLAFNIGLGNFANSTVLREVNRRHFVRAAAAFRLWSRGGAPPRVLPGLVRRRAAEVRLFIRPLRK